MTHHEKYWKRLNHESFRGNWSNRTTRIDISGSLRGHGVQKRELLSTLWLEKLTLLEARDWRQRGRWYLHYKYTIEHMPYVNMVYLIYIYLSNIYIIQYIYYIYILYVCIICIVIFTVFVIHQIFVHGLLCDLTCPTCPTCPRTPCRCWQELHITAAWRCTGVDSWPSKARKRQRKNIEKTETLLRYVKIINSYNIVAKRHKEALFTGFSMFGKVLRLPFFAEKSEPRSVGLQSNQGWITPACLGLDLQSI